MLRPDFCKIEDQFCTQYFINLKHFGKEKDLP